MKPLLALLLFSTSLAMAQTAGCPTAANGTFDSITNVDAVAKVMQWEQQHATTIL